MSAQPRSVFSVPHNLATCPILATRREKLLGGLHTGIETVNLCSTSKMVSEYSGMMLQKHKVGAGRSTRCFHAGLSHHVTVMARGSGATHCTACHRLAGGGA